jgi:hypothetical protein
MSISVSEVKVPNGFGPMPPPNPNDSSAALQWLMVVVHHIYERTNDIDELRAWRDKHNEHHGKDDVSIGRRLGASDERSRLARYVVEMVKYAAPTGVLGVALKAAGVL